MSTLYRAQILLEQEQHQALSEMAEQEGRSISELVREIVGEHLAEQDREARLRREMQALEALTRIRRQIEAQHGVLQADFLAEARQEREEDIERVWRGEP
jgi:hypothetical protein